MIRHTPPALDLLVCSVDGDTLGCETQELAWLHLFILQCCTFFRFRFYLGACSVLS